MSSNLPVQVGRGVEMLKMALRDDGDREPRQRRNTTAQPARRDDQRWFADLHDAADRCNQSGDGSVFTTIERQRFRCRASIRSRHNENLRDRAARRGAQRLSVMITSTFEGLPWRSATDRRRGIQRQRPHQKRRQSDLDHADADRGLRHTGVARAAASCVAQTDQLPRRRDLATERRLRRRSRQLVGGKAHAKRACQRRRSRRRRKKPAPERELRPCNEH